MLVSLVYPIINGEMIRQQLHCLRRLLGMICSIPDDIAIAEEVPVLAAALDLR